MGPVKLANVTVSQLEYLDAALAHDTWKDAAAAVGVSPSAFSQGLAELERRLGVALFDRQGRQRTARPEARVAAEHGTRILAELRGLSRWAEETREGGVGQLTIGMIDTAAVHHFGDALVAFRTAHPDVSLRLLVQPSASLLDALDAGEVDAIVCVQPEATEDLEITPLLAEALHVYAPPGTTAGPPERWGPWVSFPADSRTRALVGRALRPRGVNFTVVAESSQPAVLREMVQLGMGWTVLAAVDAEREPHALRRAIDAPVAERVLALCRRSDREPSAALARLIDTLLRSGSAR
jgi:DNA-binding transcriptional LysR family regulator